MDNKHQLVLWIGALVVGAMLGLLDVAWINSGADFIATVYTRLFRLLAVPTIAIAVISTIASFGGQKETGRIFRTTIFYTLTTTFAATIVGLILYLAIAPGNLPAELISNGAADVPKNLGALSYADHFLSVVPDNAVRPFLEGNVLSVLLLAFAIGFALVKLPDTESKAVIVKGIQGLQELLFMLIHGLIWSLPLGIVAFSAQLTAQVSGGMAIDSIGKYVAVIICGNVLQFFVVLPIFLLLRGINPIKTLSGMMPAVLMALFTKSSAATLPVTMQCAEQRLGVSSRVSRFVLPICTTINMNGCAAFIFVTSMWVMQNGGIELTFSTMLLWVFLSVFSAVGNAGVPMGCYFLTFSLVSGTGSPIGIMGIILPIYTIIDMIETAENVWSDSCVCAMTNKK